MFEHHLHHVHEVAGTQLGVPSCIHHYVWLRWTRLDIMALAPLLGMYCNMDKTFSASTRKINKWTCGKPDVRAAPRNRFIYCQNIAKVMLVQVLLLLRSSTHTHTPGSAGLFYSFSFSGKQLTKKIQSHVSVFPEFVVHGYVGQEIEGQGVLVQLRVVVV